MAFAVLVSQNKYWFIFIVSVSIAASLGKRETETASYQYKTLITKTNNKAADPHV